MVNFFKRQKEKLLNIEKENLYVLLFFLVLTIILTWPAAWHFFSSVPSSGSDTMQVVGVAGNKANLISDQGFFRGTFSLIKSSEFSITTLYAYFQLIFGRVVGYNILFFLSFILSGYGTYLLTIYLVKNKPAALIAGIIFAFSPFHFHNALGTNVGTMHQEWLPFFALFIFKFFDDLKLKNFIWAALFLFLIGFSEHQLLAFTAIFIGFFLIYKLIVQPKTYLRPKLWIYFGACAVVLSIAFFFMFRSLFVIANSQNNFLDAGLKSALKYSNDSLSIFVPPNFHSIWSDAFSGIRDQFKRRSNSDFSDYAGYSVLILSLFSLIGLRYFKKKNMPTKGLIFWWAVAVGFYVLSWGPYLQFKGLLDPPVKMPYFLIYQYLPFYKNIRTVGRLFIWSMLGFSVLAAWGATYLELKISDLGLKKAGGDDAGKEKSIKRSRIFYSIVGIIIAVEFLAIPVSTDSLAHSSFYEKLGKDKENYNVLEIPGSTNYNFASRDLVWKSIHRKNTINGYDFARVNEDNFSFQRSTPIVRSLLYAVPEGSDNGDLDIMKNSYYSISNEILNYYNIRYIILDKEGLKGDPAKGDLDMLYPAKAYIANVIKCSDEYDDDFLYACQVDQSEKPNHMFLALDSSSPHWIGKSSAKSGIQRFAENGAGLKLVNMTGVVQSSKLDFSVKISKPLRIKVFLNSQEVHNEYVTTLGKKKNISADLPEILPGDNQITFGVYGADNSEIYSEKKMDTVAIYQVDVE